MIISTAIASVGSFFLPDSDPTRHDSNGLYLITNAPQPAQADRTELLPRAAVAIRVHGASCALAKARDARAYLWRRSQLRRLPEARQNAQLKHNDWLLLCSSRLTEALSDADIGSILRRSCSIDVAQDALQTAARARTRSGPVPMMLLRHSRFEPRARARQGIEAIRAAALASSSWLRSSHIRRPL